jgi:predicted nucleic acid-binding protein
MRGIADTGFLVAFAARRDRYFSWAFNLAKEIQEPLVTCEAVLAETAFHLRDSSFAMNLVATGLIRLDFSLRENLSEVAALADRYADREPDLADLCLIRMSELFPDLPVITIDSDFQIYRRNRKQRIPLITPPANL